MAYSISCDAWRSAVSCPIQTRVLTAGGRGFARAYKVRDRHFYIETEVGGRLLLLHEVDG